jgi:chromosome segregation ATPase
MSIAELVTRAYEISGKLNPGLKAQSEDWASLKIENEALRSDLRTTQGEAASLRIELASLKAELEKRSSEASASAEELSEARTALKRISVLVGSSTQSWESSIADVERALKEAAKKQRRAELRACVAEVVAVAAIVFAGVQASKNKEGK